jgi:ParB-like chromosome segregation protein Spo0J
MRGCEYLLAAKELGYEAIDCIIADDEVWLKAIEYALKQG